MTSEERPPTRAEAAEQGARHVAATAQHLFMTKGFDAVTVDELARAAQISRRTFFNYFDSKAAAFWFDPALDAEQMYAALDECGEGTSWDDVVEIVAAWSDSVAPHHREHIRRRFEVIDASEALRTRMPALTLATTDHIARALGADRAVGLDETLIRAAAASMATSSRVIVRAWVDGQMQEPPAVALRVVLRSIAESFARALESPHAGPTEITARTIPAR